MMQQINLYQPMFRKQKVIFSAATMLQVGIFFLAVFTAMYFYQSMKLKPFQSQLAKINSELIQLESQIAAMEAAQSNKSKSKLLVNEIAKLSAELAKRERVSVVLATRAFGNQSGFSSYLEAFARGHIEGTWLTDVSINQGGASLGLKGKTLSSKLVPIYIQNLSDQKSLQGSSFNVMELARVETDEGDAEINFMISTN